MKPYSICAAFLFVLAGILAAAPADPQAPAKPDEKAKDNSTPTPLPYTGPPPLDLAACRRLARERQPALAAYRANVARSEAAVKALENLLFAELIQKDLPYRRRQSVHGLNIARTRLVLGETETNHSVTRTYLTALFALEQKAVAEEGIKILGEIQLAFKDVPAAIDNPQAERLKVLMDLARGRKAEAESGHRRALAALAEAIGLESPEGLVIVGTRLPDLEPAFDPRQVFELSLLHRPELIMANEFAAGSALEVQAQGEIKNVTASTFAAGADLHAEPLPPGPTDTEYRPYPLGPEMPTTLAGCREDRVIQARLLCARSYAFVAKTRNLVALEARNTLLRWEELNERRPYARNANDKAKALAETQTDDFKSDIPKDSTTFGTRLASVTEAGLLATVARLEHNQIRFDRLLVLALLEKITGGMFRPGFE